MTFYIKDEKLFSDNTPITQKLDGLIYDDVLNMVEVFNDSARAAEDLESCEGERDSLLDEVDSLRDDISGLNSEIEDVFNFLHHLADNFEPETALAEIKRFIDENE